MKYQSPSTPETQHDLFNFVVEAVFINRHGALPSGCWRKGQALSKEWSKMLTKVKRVSTLGVSTEQLAWFVKFYKITDLDYKEFGLLRWKIARYFKYINIDHFVNYYASLHKQLAEKSSSYVENTVGYKTKEAAPSKRKSLSDILKELEDEQGANSGTTS